MRLEAEDLLTVGEARGEQRLAGMNRSEVGVTQ